MLFSVSQFGGYTMEELKRMDVVEFFIVLSLLEEKAAKQK